MAYRTACLTLACIAAVWATDSAAADEVVRKIAVNASITNEVPVTNVHYHLTVELVKPTLAVAKQDVDASIGRLRDRLKALSVESIILQDRGLEQGRRYKRESGADPKFVGYFVQRSLLIELKDFKLADRLETILAESEEFSLSSRSFSNSDEIRLRHEARKSALEAAQRKARSMAAVLEMTVGAPLDISEGGGRDSRGMISTSRSARGRSVTRPRRRETPSPSGRRSASCLS